MSESTALTGRTVAEVWALSVVAMVLAGFGLVAVNALIPRVLLILLFPAVLAGDVVMFIAYRRQRAGAVTD